MGDLTPYRAMALAVVALAGGFDDGYVVGFERDDDAGITSPFSAF